MSLALSLLFVALAHADETATVINCVDGSMTKHPSQFVNDVLDGWGADDSFSGIAANSPEAPGEIANIFFTQGFFNGGTPTTVFHSKLDHIYQNTRGDRACIVKSGPTTQ